MVNLRATEFSYEVERQTFATCEADPLQDLFQAEQNAAKKIELAKVRAQHAELRAQCATHAFQRIKRKLKSSN
ncbi:MAG TPA: hypothetical protein PLP22_08865 [Candidatus Competibacter sp.]|nr:hypothetical protein [Candidatus Competibacter sp.]HUM93994.1 hypothetical protein [Candidatus Competibacter sp.]